MSAMRRSSSLSRIPVKDAYRTTLHRTNSSSDLARPSSTTKTHITVPSTTGKLRRSYSATNLRVSRAKTPNIGRSQSPVRDLRPLNDKAWQQKQLARIRAYLSSRPDLTANLKPMCIAVYVEAMGLLLAKIDSRIVVKKENYKEVVPYYMKLLGYPATISPSLMKSVNIAHSWPHVLAMMSWIVDLIDANVNASESLLKSGKGTLSVINKYIALNVEIDENVLLDELKQALLEEHCVDLNELETLNVQAENLRSTVQKSREQEDIVRAEIMSQEKIISDHEYEQKRKLKLEEQRQFAQAKIDGLKSKIAQQDENLALRNMRIKDLKVTIASQEGQRQKIAQLKRKEEELKDQINATIQTNSEMEKVYATFDLELQQKLNKLKALVTSRNTELTDLMHLDTQLYDLQFRTFGFTHADYPEHVATISRKASSMAANYKKLSSRQKAQLEEAIETRKQLERKLVEERTNLARIEGARSKRMTDKDRVIAELRDEAVRLLEVKKRREEVLERMEVEQRELEMKVEALEEECTALKLRNKAAFKRCCEEIRDGVKCIKDLGRRIMEQNQCNILMTDELLDFVTQRKELYFSKLQDLMCKVNETYSG